MRMMQIKKTFLKKNKQQLESVKGSLIFFAISLSVINLLVMHGTWLTIFIFMLTLLRIYRTKQLKLYWGCFFCLLIGALLFTSVRYNEYHHQLGLTEEKTSLDVIVEPDSLQVDGNFATIFAYKSTTKERLQLRYKLANKQEKQWFQKQTGYVLLNGQAELTFPEWQRNLNGFDYQAFLKEKKIYRVGQLKSIQQAKAISVYSPVKWLKVIRKKGLTYFEQTFSPITASYMKSLLLGMKDSEFKNQQQILGKLGILHFFSLSGMHLYFFISIFRYFCLRLGLSLEHYYWVEMLFLFAFLVLTGITTSVGRCVVMMCLASSNRRFNWGFSALDCWSMTLMGCLSLNLYLLTSAAGQLSFGLTFYIVYLKGKLKTIRQPFLNSCCFSLSLSVLSVPIICYHFHGWNVLAIGLSTLFLPVFSQFVLPLLLLELVLSFFFKELFFFDGVTSFLGILQTIFEKLSDWDSFSIVTGKIPVIIYGICLILSILWLGNGSKNHFAQSGLLIAMLILPSFGKWVNPTGMVAFVDIGQGDSIFLQTPFHQEAMLIDTGGRLEFEQEDWQQRTRKSTNADSTLLPFLKAQGVKKLNKLFITHSDEDHMGDLLRVSEEATIKELYYPVGVEKKKGFLRMLIQLQNEGVHLNPILAGETWQVSNQILFQTLYPFKAGEGKNNDSLVVKLTVLGHRFLLTGDLEELGEQELIIRYSSNQLAVETLKAGHHGSKSSSSEAFLKKVAPQEAVISCGKNNRFGHPHEEVTERMEKLGIRMLRTDKQGMIYYQWHRWDSQLSDARSVK